MRKSNKITWKFAKACCSSAGVAYVRLIEFLKSAKAASATEVSIGLVNTTGEVVIGTSEV